MKTFNKGDKVKLIEGNWITGDGSKFVYPGVETVICVYEVKTKYMNPYYRVKTEGYDADGMYMTSDTPAHQLIQVTA